MINIVYCTIEQVETSETVFLLVILKSVDQNTGDIMRRFLASVTLSYYV
jgi:hypothetical protein